MERGLFLSPMVTAEFPEAIPFFRDLPHAARAAAAARGTMRRYGADQALFLAGDPPQAMCVVLTGRVRVMRERQGRQYVVHVEGPGGTLGEIPLLDGGPSPASAFAAEPTECLRLDQVAFPPVLAADPTAAWPFLERLARRAREVVERLDRLSTLDVAARIARFLLDHADGHARVRVRQGDMAEELGTVREVVVRILGRFRRDGIIRTSARGELTIPDRTRLRHLSADDR
jgi:CRP/FNR family transcriptional regulator